GATGAVGTNFWLGGRVSFWPKVSLGIWQTRTKIDGPFMGLVSINGTPVAVGSTVTENAVFVELYAPLLFHLAPHFMVGLGPEAYADIVNKTGGASNRRRFLGASSTLGGWF